MAPSANCAAACFWFAAVRYQRTASTSFWATPSPSARRTPSTVLSVCVSVLRCQSKPSTGLCRSLRHASTGLVPTARARIARARSAAQRRGDTTPRPWRHRVARARLVDRRRRERTGPRRPTPLAAGPRAGESPRSHRPPPPRPRVLRVLEEPQRSMAGSTRDHWQIQL